MTVDDEVKFLEELRRLIDEYLVLGYAPGSGTSRLTRGRPLPQSVETLLGARYPVLRREIAERKPRGKQLLALARVPCVIVQHPPAVIAGGPVIEQHFLDAVTENRTWENIAKSTILDAIDQAIGAFRSGLAHRATDTPHLERRVTKGFVFIAMPMIDDDPGLDDVHGAIKEVARQLDLVAERVDDPQSNRRITDRVLESLQQAEFVVVDLTHERPNVYFEAGIAHGYDKLPIYIARVGTNIQFDLKDYPVIFFKNITELKERLSKRLAGLIEEKD